MKLLQNLSFKTRIVAAVCMITLIVILLVSYLNYRWYSEQLLDQTMEQTQQIIEQAGSNINSYINELYRLTLTPYYDDDLLAALAQESGSTQQQLESKRTVESFLSSVMSLPRSEVLRVYIMNDSALYSYTRTPYEMSDYLDYQESGWYQKALTTTDPILIPPRLERVYGNNLTPVFSVVRQLRSKEDNNITLGVVKVDADYKGIRSICDKVDLDAGGSLIIVNEQQQILYTSGAVPSDLDVDVLQSAIPQNGAVPYVSQNGRYLINRFTLSDCGITLFAFHSYTVLMQPLQENMMKTILLALGSMFLAVVVVIWVINRFMKPLFNIIQLMKEAEGGNLQVAAEVSTHDEIGFLAESFNNMIGALNATIHRNIQLTKEIYQAQYLTKEAQYNSLCSQIKPHFLYNVLNTTSLLIKCGEYDTAIRSVEDLSYYLGGIMNVDRDITIRHELEICRAYLDLVQLRYQDRLSYSISVDDTVMEYTIPSLSLQPLIENAVKYACEPRRQPTRISVSSYLDDNDLVLRVEDNGPGLDAAVLDKLYRRMNENEPMPEQNEEVRGSIGILNIYKRFRLKYGPNANVSINTSEQGTTVSLHLPLTTEGGNHVPHNDR